MLILIEYRYQKNVCQKFGENKSARPPRMTTRSNERVAQQPASFFFSLTPTPTKIICTLADAHLACFSRKSNQSFPPLIFFS
jgi:hypothetical protein